MNDCCSQVLDKFPIAQHILFGKLISFDPVVKAPGDGLFKKPAPVSTTSPSEKSQPDDHAAVH